MYSSIALIYIATQYNYYVFLGFNLSSSSSVWLQSEVCGCEIMIGTSFVMSDISSNVINSILLMISLLRKRIYIYICFDIFQGI